MNANLKIARAIAGVVMLLYVFLASAFISVPKAKIDPNKIRPNIQQYLIYLERGNTTRIISHQIRTNSDTIWNGEPALVVIQRFQPKGNVDTCILARNTIFPMAYKSATGNKKEKFTFSQSIMTGTITEKDSTNKEFSVPIASPTNVSVAQLELLQSLELKLNATFTSTLINPGYPAIKSQIFVVNQEQISAGGSIIDCGLWSKKGIQCG